MTYLADYNANKLYHAIKAVCPIVGLSVTDWSDRATWRIDPDPSSPPTPEQLTAAQGAIQSFTPLSQSDWDAQSAAEVVRSGAIRLDAARITMLNQLATATSAQIETYVRNQLNADGVTNLATAVSFCKRVETAIVQIAKVLALNVQ